MSEISQKPSPSLEQNAASSTFQAAGLRDAFFALLRRDLTVTLRRRSQWLNPLVFFVIVVSLFPLGIGPEANTLQTIGPGVIWVGALLATLLSLDSLFTTDHDDGTLEQLTLSTQPLSLLCLAKIIAHWITSGIPLILISPLLSLFMQMPLSTLPVLMASLALGTLALSLIGAIGAALTVGLRHAGVLLSLLILPLFIPVLIFGTSAVHSHILGLPVEAQLSLLAAISVLALTLAPLAVAAAVRIGIGSH